MGRPSRRAERRQQILHAFAQVLADHGYAGATIMAVADAAGIAPGLVHHHFDNKAELLSALLAELSARFRARMQSREPGADELAAYADAALKLDARADVTAAKCWVGLFAEGVRDPGLFQALRRMLDAELEAIQARSGGRLSAHAAGAILAYIIGALVLGAFAPKKTAGFAAPGLHTLIAALRQEAERAPSPARAERDVV
jgi:TetR/AcrR family transcriptional repressor of bet genes